ncbi:MAG: RNA 2',3'-cyclic phosphodiesterase [Candidatus Nitrosocaldaceae archaeon]|nr:MAG: RNA 2',3'-cyclic phosphodiesterase [Candidatus Nitrosocaldaceae archaeon]
MRVFIAMDIKSNAIKDNIIKKQKDILANINAKPTKAEQLHFTLMFLGEISDAMLESIKEKLNEIKFKPINVKYKGVGAFPSSRSARIIWIGVDEESSKELKKIAKIIEDKLSSLGFTTDKEFTPHITILRVKNKVNCNDIISDEEFGEEILDEIKVKKSELRPSGPVYSDLFTIHAS